MSWRAYLTYGGETLAIGSGDVRGGVNATSDGIECWHSTSDSKWTLTERSTSDGAYGIDEADVLYSSRTVTLTTYAEGATRDELIANHDALLRAAHRECTLRVVDGGQDTYVTGYMTVDAKAGTVSGARDEVVLTLQCPDPRRLSTTADTCTLEPSSGGITGGLSYGDGYGLSYGDGYGLSYGDVDGDVGNVGTVANGGTAEAYPIATVYGTFDDGFTLYMLADGERREVSYSAPVLGTPVVLDYRVRTATAGGSDRSRYLTAREFGGVAPGGSATFNLQADGDGWAEVELRDTYV